MQDPAKTRKKLGRRIRALRQQRNLSQEQFAYECDLGRSFAGSIERGERDIRITTLCKLAGFFKIPLSELFKD